MQMLISQLTRDQKAMTSFAMTSLQEHVPPATSSQDQTELDKLLRVDSALEAYKDEILLRVGGDRLDVDGSVSERIERSLLRLDVDVSW